jgi:hypothetical protein
MTLLKIVVSFAFIQVFYSMLNLLVMFVFSNQRNLKSFLAIWCCISGMYRTHSE